MKKNVQKILFAVPIVVGLYLIVRQLTKGSMQKPLPEPNPEPNPDPTDPVVSPSSTDNFPLKRGSKGARVIELQKYILKKDPKALPKFGVDGIFGKETEDALYRLFFAIITIDNGVISINNQAQLNKIKEAAKPTYKPGDSLVIPYNPFDPFKPVF